MTAQTRSSSQIWHGIFDRVFRIGEQLVILFVVVAAWKKSSPYTDSVFMRPVGSIGIWQHIVGHKLL